MVLGHDPHQSPTQILDEVAPTNVAHILPPIRPVVVAVVLDTDQQLRPAHVQISDNRAVIAVHRDLRGRSWQPTSNEDEAQV